MVNSRETIADYAEMVQRVYGSDFLKQCVIEWAGIGYRSTLPIMLPTIDWPEARYSVDEPIGQQTEAQMWARTDELRRVANRIEAGLL